MTGPDDPGLRAVDWLCANRDRFFPFSAGPEPVSGSEQAIGELAILCRQLVLRWPTEGMRALVEPLVAVLRAVFDSPLFRHRLHRVKDEFIPYALVAVALRDAGGLDGGPQRRVLQRRALQRVVRHTPVTFTERTPHRLLELRRLLDVAGLTHRLPSYGALCRTGNLGRRVNPVHLTDYDIYSITHTLFFATDFGRVPLVPLPAGRFDRAVETVDVLTAMQIARGNWDLVGELLLSAHCLGDPDTEFSAAGRQALRCAQRPDGAVPGPNYHAATAAGLGGPALDAYVFRHCYHTTLVAALVGALCPAP